jgi:hypothetical protein
MMVVVVLIAAAMTSHTHFSGHETLRERFQMALVLFGALLCFMIAAVLVRI